MKKKRRVVMCRLVDRSKAKRDFDRQFWKKVGVLGRFVAAWQMVLQAGSVNKKYAVSQSGLQRSVEVLKPRKG